MSKRAFDDQASFDDCAPGVSDPDAEGWIVQSIDLDAERPELDEEEPSTAGRWFAWTLLGSVAALTLGGAAGMALALTVGSGSSAGSSQAKAGAAGKLAPSVDDAPALSQAEARTLLGEAAGPEAVAERGAPMQSAPVLASGLGSGLGSVGLDGGEPRIKRAPPRPPWVGHGAPPPPVAPISHRPSSHSATRYPAKASSSPPVAKTVAPVAKPSAPAVLPTPEAVPAAVAALAPLADQGGPKVKAELPVPAAIPPQPSNTGARFELPDVAEEGARPSNWPPDIED